MTANGIRSSNGIGTTSQGTILADTVHPKTALSHGHALLAATVPGRLSDADVHTTTEQWRAKADTLALDFWNRATTAISNQPTSSTTNHGNQADEFNNGNNADRTTTGHTERPHTSTRAATGHGKAASLLVRHRPRVRLLTVGQVPVGKATR